MKKTFLLFITATALFLGCQPSEEPDRVEDGYFVEFKANGNPVRMEPKFGYIMTFMVDPASQLHTSSFAVLKNETEGNKNLVNLQLRSNEPFTTNQTYRMQDAVSVNGVPIPRIHFTYSGEDGVVFQAILLKENYPSLNVTDDMVLTFTEIGENVAGTFSGIIFRSDQSPTTDREFITITEGKFRLKKKDA